MECPFVFTKFSYTKQTKMKAKVILAIVLFVLNTILCLGQSGIAIKGDDTFTEEDKRIGKEIIILRNIRQAMQNSCDSIQFYSVQYYNVPQDEWNSIDKKILFFQKELKERINTYNLQSRIFFIPYKRLQVVGLKQEYSYENFTCISE